MNISVARQPIPIKFTSILTKKKSKLKGFKWAQWHLNTRQKKFIHWMSVSKSDPLLFPIEHVVQPQDRTGQDIFKEEEGLYISYVIRITWKQHASLVADVTFATFRFRSPLTIKSLSTFLYNIIIQQNGWSL